MENGPPPAAHSLLAFTTRPTREHGTHGLAAPLRDPRPEPLQSVACRGAAAGQGDQGLVRKRIQFSPEVASRSTRVHADESMCVRGIEPAKAPDLTPPRDHRGRIPSSASQVNRFLQLVDDPFAVDLNPSSDLRLLPAHSGLHRGVSFEQPACGYSRRSRRETGSDRSRGRVAVDGVLLGEPLLFGSQRHAYILGNLGASAPPVREHCCAAP
jgi:hypothetical protein